MFHTPGSFSVSNSNDANFYQPSLRRVELRILQLGLENGCCKTIQVQLAMMQSMFHAQNASSQLVISVKGVFVESLNATKVT